MADPPAAIDFKQFRQVLGQYPTGVCVVTSTGADGNLAGMVVGSFTSVSLDLPLVGFFPDRNSSSWPKVASSKRFCVNILSADQEDVCRKLSSKDPDKFASIAHQPSPLGSPIIDGVVAWIDCDLHSVSEAGDHFIVLGAVRQLEIAEGGLPLLFFQGGYAIHAGLLHQARILNQKSGPKGIPNRLITVENRSRSDRRRRLRRGQTDRACADRTASRPARSRRLSPSAEMDVRTTRAADYAALAA